MTRKITSAAAQVFEQGTQSLQTDSSEAFERLYLRVHALEQQTRETFQYQFRRDYLAVVEKLKTGEHLDETDKHLVAQLLVADAKSYVRHAADYEAWKD
jgi:hypothetical protein